MTVKLALLGHKIDKPDLTQVKQIYSKVEGRDTRNELNLYVSGYEDDPEPPPPSTDGAAAATPETAAAPQPEQSV